MRTRLRLATIPFVLAVPCISAAEDVGAIMAAFRDQKTECRYLDKLAGNVEGAAKNVAQAMEATKANIAAGNSLSYEAAKRERAIAAATGTDLDGSLNGFMRSVGDFGTAVQVLESKHDKPPACVAKARARMEAAAHGLKK